MTDKRQTEMCFVFDKLLRQNNCFEAQNLARNSYDCYHKLQSVALKYIMQVKLKQLTFYNY